MEDKKLQRVNVFLASSPIYPSIKKQINSLFEEILEHLLLTEENREFEPSFTIWSNKLKEFLSLYGYSFTKTDHLKLVEFYLSILSIENLNYIYVQICFDLLHQLLQRSQLLTRDDLTIDWKIFKTYAKFIFEYEDKICRLTILPEGIRGSLDHCVDSCSLYFSSTATQEILDEFRPLICPIDSNFVRTMKLFELFLPVVLPEELHEQGFKLWLDDFFTIWQNFYNKSTWELFMLILFSSLSWNNIGYINWEKWFDQIFTRLLRGFNLPIGKMKMSSQEYSYFVDTTSKWVVAMIENGNSCLKYLEELLFSIKTFYHPSNTDILQENLVDFLVSLSKHFVDRVHIERRTRPFWHSVPRQTAQLTEDDITNFVNCIKDYVFMSIFNKDYDNEAAVACQYLSILRPELIIPTILDKYHSSIENLHEPHRYISLMNCLQRVARQLVQQTDSYSEGQLFVLPLLNSILPAIDLNDIEKTYSTLDFIESIVCQITFIDCPSISSTGKFEDFIIEFLTRIFFLIENLSTNFSDSLIINKDIDIDDLAIEAKLSSILFHIAQNSSDEIFKVIRERLLNLTDNPSLSTEVRDIVTSLIESIVRANPNETLKYFLPKIRQSVDENRTNLENTEFTWYLAIFSKLVSARGEILINYKTDIFYIFDQCLPIENKKSYEILSSAAKCFLQSLTQIYPIEYKLTNEDLEIPTQAWGKSIDYDKLDVRFHFPTDEEIELASEFIEKYLYSQIDFLKENNSKLTNNQRLKSLTIIEAIGIGSFRLVPPIESQQIQAFESIQSKYQIQYDIFFKPLKLKENLRSKLLNDIEQILSDTDPDDVLSISQAIDFYSYISTYFGLFALSIKYSSLDLLTREQLLLNKLAYKAQSIRPLAIERMFIQIQQIEVSQQKGFTETDKQIILKLFQLSIHRYAQVRERAQMELFNVLKTFPYSFQFIVDEIIEILTQSEYYQLKGCLYVLLGDQDSFLPNKLSWPMKEKLWLSLVSIDSTNDSIDNLIDKVREKIIDQFVTMSLVDQVDFESYCNLIEKLTLFMKNDLLTWKQQTFVICLLIYLFREDIPIPLVTIEVLLHALRHQCEQIRKYAEKGIIAICHLQKPKRILVEKSWETYDQLRVPQSELEWEELCFVSNSSVGYLYSPKKLQFYLNKRERFTLENFTEQTKIFYDYFNDENYLNEIIQLMISEDETAFSRNRFSMFKGLFRNFGLLFFDKIFDQICLLINDKSKEKQLNNHRVASEILSGIIRGSKYWTLDMTNQLWQRLDPFLNEIWLNINNELADCWSESLQFIMENIDPRRMFHLVEHFRRLINKDIEMNEIIRWTIIQRLIHFQWKIPSIWHEINRNALPYLNHTSDELKFKISVILAMSISFDVEKHPNADQLFDYLGKRLNEEINFDLDMNDQIMNFIETVIQIHTSFYFWNHQPIRQSIINLFYNLCDLENVTTNDENFKENLTVSRLLLAVSYFKCEYIPLMIEQLTKVCCESPKWHCRRSGIEFIQNFVFSNMFNVRPYAEQIHKIIFKCLFDDQIEVRILSCETLSGLYQCGFIEVTREDFKYFQKMSKTKCSSQISNELSQRHGGILGLCAIVLSSPYDIQKYVPNALMILCEHSNQPNIVQKSIRNCLSEFRRTHQDSWIEHKQLFTDDQLTMLSDVLISHNYYV